MPSYKLKLDVSKLDKEAFFHGKNGAIYCDLVIWENRDGEDQYGNTHAVKQDFGKDKGPEKPPYVGNMRELGGGGGNKGGGRDRDARTGYRQGSAADQQYGRGRDNGGSYGPDDSDDVPFRSYNPPLGI